MISTSARPSDVVQDVLLDVLVHASRGSCDLEAQQVNPEQSQGTPVETTDRYLLHAEYAERPVARHQPSPCRTPAGAAVDDRSPVGVLETFRVVLADVVTGYLRLWFLEP